MKKISNKMNDDEFKKIEEELLKKDQEKRKKTMPVSGRGVFEILRIKNKSASQRIKIKKLNS